MLGDNQAGSQLAHVVLQCKMCLLIVNMHETEPQRCAALPSAIGLLV